MNGTEPLYHDTCVFTVFWDSNQSKLYEKDLFSLISANNNLFILKTSYSVVLIIYSVFSAC